MLLSFCLLIMIWVIAQGITYGSLHNLEKLNPNKSADIYSWVGPQWKLPVSWKRIELILEGSAPHSQLLQLKCQHEVLEHHQVSGYFKLILVASKQCDTALVIHSSWYMVPADGIGSVDIRQLSYKIFSVKQNNTSIFLEKLIQQTVGEYGIERGFGRSSPEEVLNYTWDSSWYQRIIKDGYQYNGNNKQQQNVVWPFLYPYLIKAVVNTTHKSSLEVTTMVSAWLTLLCLILAFALGRIVGLSHIVALIPPIWLSFNPYAFFLFGGFSESLFIVLQISCLIAIIYQRWWLAALIIALLSATRFIGIVALIWLAIYWFWMQGRFQTKVSTILTLGAFTLIASSGVIADIIIKWGATGFWFAGFEARSAFSISSFEVIQQVFDINSLFTGSYLPLLWLCGLLLFYSIAILFLALKAKTNNCFILLIFSGISISLFTVILNPEIQSVGRYFLPFITSIIGILGYKPCQQVTLFLLYFLSTVGAALMVFNFIGIYQGFPPF